jgi:hypothetical protein
MISIVVSENLIVWVPTYVTTRSPPSSRPRDDHTELRLLARQPIDHWVNESWLTGICLQYAGNLLPAEVIIFE